VIATVLFLDLLLTKGLNMKIAAAVSAIVIIVTGSCFAQPEIPATEKKADRNRGDQMYKLDTGDVIALSYGNDVSSDRTCTLHVVQVNGDLNFSFGDIRARQNSIAEVREQLARITDKAAEKGMHNIIVTVFGLRSSDNDLWLQNILWRSQQNK
jgi:hypothetical protein